MLKISFAFFVVRVLTIGLPVGSASLAAVPLFVFGAFLLFASSVKKNFKVGMTFLFFNHSFLLALVIVSSFLAVLNGFPLEVSVVLLGKILIVVGVIHLGYWCGASVSSAKYFKVIFFVMVFHVFMGVVMSIFGHELSVHGTSRAIGIAGGVQIYANLVMFLFVMSFSLIYFNSSIFSLRFTYSVFFLCLVALFLSSTLKNFLVALLVVLLMLSVSVKKLLIFSLCAFFAGFFIMLIFPDYIYSSDIYQRFQVIIEGGFTTQLMPGEKLESSLVWRLIHWELLLSDWVNNYLFFGSGFGQSINMEGLKTPSGEGYEVHSDLIAFLIEFGAVLFPFFFFVLLYPVFKVFLLSRKFGYPIYSAVYFSSVSILLSAIGGNVFYSLAAMYFMWFYIGWVIGNTDYR